MTRKELLGYARVCGYRVVRVDYGYDVDRAGGVLIGTNSGVYGWNWNAYILGNFIIVQGYRNFPTCESNYFINHAFKNFKKACIAGENIITAQGYFKQWFDLA